MQGRILAISDRVEPMLERPEAREHLGPIDFVVSCGDLPYRYIEWVVDSLNVPGYFVRGNHEPVPETREPGQRSAPGGAADLHRRVRVERDVILAGIEGSLRYRPGPFQYSQREMWQHVWRLVPALMVQRISRGRYLDVFVTHAPVWGLDDRADRPHRGARAFRWLLRVFRPLLHLHGHVHMGSHRPEAAGRFAGTRVVNACGYRTVSLDTNGARG